MRQDLDRIASDALIAEAYRTGKLSIGQAAGLLELAVHDAYGFMKARGIPVRYTGADFEADCGGLREARDGPARHGVAATAEEGAWGGLPTPLTKIREEIERSRVVLELRENWDDAGSPAIREDTWRRAVDFLVRLAAHVYEEFGKPIDVPDICPGPGGSVDLHWDRPEYELLVNISANPDAMAGFYGDDRGSISIKGKLDPDRVNDGLVLWLKNGR